MHSDHLERMQRKGWPIAASLALLVSVLLILRTLATSGILVSFPLGIFIMTCMIGAAIGGISFSLIASILAWIWVINDSPLRILLASDTHSPLGLPAAWGVSISAGALLIGAMRERLIGLYIGHALRHKLSSDQLRELTERLQTSVMEQTRQLRKANEELVGTLNRQREVCAELRAQEALLELIIESLPSPVAYLSHDLRYQLCNHSFAQLAGEKKSKMIGSSLLGLSNPYFLSGTDRSIQAALGGKTTRFSVDFSAHPNRGVLGTHFSVIIAPNFQNEIGLELGKVQGVLVALTDETAHIEAESKLRKAREQAVQLSDQKSQFLVNVSHEIRTPLGAMLGFAEMLADPQCSDIEREIYAASVKRNGIQLAAIVDDVLDMSRLHSGDISLCITPGNLGDVVQTVISELAETAARNDVNVQLTFCESPPPSLEIDHLRVRQITVNLLSNAIKFSPGGRVRVDVSFKKIAKSRYAIRVEIADTGCGIEEVDFERIFDTFVQADGSSTRRAGGIGIGLPISRKVARLMHGDIELVRSSKDAGSVFAFHFLTEGADSAAFYRPAPVRKVSDLSSAFAPSSPFDVLIVEDMPDNRILLQHQIQKLGARVKAVTNGLEAVSATELESFDLILMDLQMPVMGGHEAVSVMRRIGYGGRIVAVTAHSIEEERSKCFASGFDGHMTKPVDSRQLQDLISSLWVAKELLPRTGLNSVAASCLPLKRCNSLMALFG